MITSTEINKRIKEAIRLFGEYSYFDKGTDEVMDFKAIIDKFSDMSTKEIANELAKVRKLKDYGEQFVKDMLYFLQDDPRMDPLYEDKRLSDLY